MLYAVSRDAPCHREAKGWLQDRLSGDEPVALPWPVILGPVRVSTQRRILPSPPATEQALQVVDGRLARPVVGVPHPGPEHWRRLRGLLLETGASGTLTMDARLAALAIETGCELCATDRHSARVPGCSGGPPS